MARILIADDDDSVRGVLKPGGRVFLVDNNRTGDPAHIVDFAYRYGKGYVVYSTIPLDYQLQFTNSPFTLIYAPNVVAYGVSLLNHPPVAHDGTVTTAEEQITVA